MKWINVNTYLPGNTEAYCLMKIYLDGICNNIVYRVGFYEGKWLDQHGIPLTEDLQVVHWFYIED